MPQWCLWVLILQVWIVYSFASIAKIYPDWLDASLPAHLMKPKANYYLIGNLLQQSWLHYGMAYVGIAFDLLIVPLMLWKRTRLVGFGISIFFHLFNSFVFHIGIFPYMSISFALFFFTAETLQKRFIPSSLRPNFKEKLKTDESTFDRNAKVFVPTYRNILVAVLGIYFLFQLALPLRHWFFKDDVLWTEEGHRLSWRMMLRAKNGHLTVWTTDKKTFIRTKYNYHALLTQKQQRAVTTKPDMLWQLAQRIKKIEAAKGKDVAVYMNSEVSVNGSSYYPFIDPKVDIAAEEWHPFKHSEWILASPKELK